MEEHTTQFVCNLPKNGLSVFDHSVGLALKGLKQHEEVCIIKRSFKSIFLQIFIIKPLT